MRDVKDREAAAAIRHRFGSSPYVAFHAPRYAYLLDVVARFRPDPLNRVLDIGPSCLTTLLAEAIRVPVDSLGFEDEGPTDSGQHYSFDLNEAATPHTWRTGLPAYDLVVMAEVIEHLHTSPSLVLRFLRAVVRPGGIVIIQTPNAATLQRRVKLALGRNPFDLINEDQSNPLHFREYTGPELRRYASGAGFAVRELAYRNYFDLHYANDHSPNQRPRWVRTGEAFLLDILPSSFRTGITMVLARPRDP